ncbi:MAG TPA: kynureninase [Nocardioidaceae bacterium]|nr:kynureninase [Nocardioidaceae bacterium]
MTTIPPDLARDRATARDAESPLADRRDLFLVPEGTIYLDGNSLGALPRAVPGRLATAVTEEWGRGLISSWNTADWIGLSRRVGAKIAPIIGVGAGDVHVGDSTSVSLFKAMVAACRMRPGRTAIVMEPSTFPTDGYVAAGVAELLGLELRWCDPADPAASLGEDVALLSLTHVDFRSGRMFDLPAVTAAAHAAGALMLWDLCHSAGAVPVELTEHEVDLAVGCTYKYLNGGPGSPAFTYVAPRHQADLDQPIPGWMGHERPFDMELGYAPAPGVSRLISGTHQVLALTALDAALDAFDGVDHPTLRAASLSLTDYFIDLVDTRLGTAFELITPREHDHRGSQVSLRHDQAYGIVQALIARGVVGDFRTPDVARFGFAPLYVTHADVYDAVEHLVAVMENQEFARTEYATRNAVT